MADRSAEFRVTCTLPEGWSAADLAKDLRGVLGELRPDAPLAWAVTEVDSPALRKVTHVPDPGLLEGGSE